VAREIERSVEIREPREERTARFSLGLFFVNPFATRRYRLVTRGNQPVSERQPQAARQQRADHAAARAVRRGQRHEPGIRREGLMWHAGSLF
jgi:hypothetical protein